MAVVHILHGDYLDGDSLVRSNMYLNILSERLLTWLLTLIMASVRC